MSAQSTQRPESRASTTSATSQHDDVPPQQQHNSQSAYMSGNPEAALLNYHASMEHQQHIPQYQHHQTGHAHPPAASYPPQFDYAAHQPPTGMPQDVQYTNNIRAGSVPVQSGTEGQDDRRRSKSAVTATNDKELREMLMRNEGRRLQDVAQEVIQKERTPLAEKTKQLFAMLW
jgi:regulatory factor X